MNLVELFGRAPLFVHAHPDDETLQTGSLIAACHNQGLHTAVVTATRGELGEIVPGTIPLDSTMEQLAAHREEELELASEVLGVDEHYWLGTAPARAEGLGNRKYQDSGMVWISEGVAGPSGESSEGTLCGSSLEEEVRDLVALIELTSPTAIVSYDRTGTYSHPDHIRTHEISFQAAQQAGIPFFEIASDINDPEFQRLELGEYLDIVIDALSKYRSQLTVYPDHIMHVGGQRDDFYTGVGIRRHEG